jgi:O-acetyl-ADP-ribose deacetylase
MAPKITKTEYLNGRVMLKIGDITKEEVDVIVNAANSSLMGGGGVDGAIHKSGGSQLLNECKQIRQTSYPDGLPTGKAVITSAGNLPAKYVIHTVGPIYSKEGKNAAKLLASCYTESLRLAVQKGISLIAFPSISTGVYGYPKDEAAMVSSQAIDDFLRADNTLNQIRLVFFAPSDYNEFLSNNVWK